MEAKQLNIFDVLRGFADENSETYKATIKILTNYPKDIPPPDDGYILQSLNEVKQPARSSAGIQIPNPPPKAISWLSRNWHWLALVGLIIGIIISLYVRKKRNKNQEVRKWEDERLTNINYNLWLNAAENDMVVSSPPVTATPMETYFTELELEKKVEERQSSDETPSSPSTDKEAIQK